MFYNSNHRGTIIILSQPSQVRHDGAAWEDAGREEQRGVHGVVDAHALGRRAVAGAVLGPHGGRGHGGPRCAGCGRC